MQLNLNNKSPIEYRTQAA
ncbi:hypothetical protein [Paenibacillus brasilensis]